MDTASLIDAVTSIDSQSLLPPFVFVQAIVDGIFGSISAAINLVASGSAGIGGSIQTALGSTVAT